VPTGRALQAARVEVREVEHGAVAKTERIRIEQ